MKALYEDTYGKQISDRTWYRVVAGLKEYFNYQTEAKSAERIVKLFAGLRHKCPSFNFQKSDFSERYKAFEHFYRMGDTKCYPGQFLHELAQYLQINLEEVPRSTKHYWFKRAGLKYSSKELYSIKNLSLVAFVAAQWAINRKRKNNVKQTQIVFEVRKQLCPSL